MHVKRLKLINFRNYKGLDIKLNDKINVFLGNNAQGKTNLLESIYVASSGKSFRTNKDSELINLDKDISYIAVEIEKNNIDKMIEIKLEKNKSKRVRINKIELDRISDLVGILNVVVFSPEDLKLIKGSPSERRSFLDREISQISPRYRHNISRYNRVLHQRNNLLKIIQKDKSKVKTIEVWDEQLSLLGSEIIVSRLNFLDKISKISADIHSKITGGLEKLKSKYVCSFKIDRDYQKEEIRKKFSQDLRNNLNKDIEKGTTEIGPHRDDIKILINNIDCRVFGSQGQQRTAALSLKLAEVQLIKNEIGEYPVLLLDDVMSELDINRRKFLLSAFKDVQTIITSTDDIDIIDKDKVEKRIFYISSGRVYQDRVKD